MQFLKKNDYGKYFVDRFGIPEEIIEKYTFWVRGKRVWAFSGEFIDVKDIEVLGIKALSLGRTPKPSTAFLRVIGKYAKKNVVNLDKEKALKFLEGEDIEGNFDVEQGYVIVKSNNDILGCGLYKGSLINQIPKKYRYEDTWL